MNSHLYTELRSSHHMKRAHILIYGKYCLSSKKQAGEQERERDPHMALTQNTVHRHLSNPIKITLTLTPHIKVHLKY